jgi:surfeit locus 1 family protein
MRRGTIFFAIFALAISLGCVRLGFWQISRLRQRQARNALVLSRLEERPAPARSVSGDSASRFRRAFAEGAYDFDHELIYALRPREGSPGVNILTPLRIAGDTAVLVNRGWVYSPNGISIDLPTWREPDSARIDGFVETYVIADVPVSTPSGARAIRRLDRDSIQRRIPYTLLPVILVQQQPPPAGAVERTPVRVAPPPLSEGSHRAYAVQWFGFALVGIVGTILVIERDRRHAATRRRADPALSG